MLAKQGWWLLVNPDSLTDRVLKGEYYPHSSFLQAGLGNRPSWI
ncbi:hypothetical protein LINGRAPRIM_LOCUS2769 [Linum grandiflorum]